MSERESVESAVKATPNLNAAARQLGASRRTLQNRMREYGLPYGTPGRRRELLPKSGASPAGSVALGVAGVVVGGALVALWLRNRGKGSSVVVGGLEEQEYLDGTTLLAAFAI